MGNFICGNNDQNHLSFFDTITRNYYPKPAIQEDKSQFQAFKKRDSQKKIGRQEWSKFKGRQRQAKQQLMISQFADRKKHQRSNSLILEGDELHLNMSLGRACQCFYQQKLVSQCVYCERWVPATKLQTIQKSNCYGKTFQSPTSKLEKEICLKSERQDRTELISQSLMIEKLNESQLTQEAQVPSNIKEDINEDLQHSSPSLGCKLEMTFKPLSPNSQEDLSERKDHQDQSKSELLVSFQDRQGIISTSIFGQKIPTQIIKGQENGETSTRKILRRSQSFCLHCTIGYQRGNLVPLIPNNQQRAVDHDYYNNRNFNIGQVDDSQLDGDSDEEQPQSQVNLAKYEAVSDHDMLEELEFSDNQDQEPIKPHVRVPEKKQGGLYGDFSFVLDIYINDGGDDSDMDGEYYGNEKNPYVSYGSVAEEDFFQLAMNEVTSSGLHKAQQLINQTNVQQ